MTLTAAQPAGLLSAQQVAQYHRDGFTILRNLYSDAEMLAWKQALRDALAREQFRHPSGVRVWMDRTLPSPVLEAMADPRVVASLRQLIGDDIEFLSSKAVFKDTGTRFGSPWHQDWFYWSGSTKLSIWIALDDATVANGCLRLIPGTHTRVLTRKEVIGDSFTHRIDDADLEGLPVVDGVCQRGDAVIFHDLLVHASHPNTTGADRWSLISTYRSAGQPDSSTTWKSSWLVSGRSVNPNAVP